MDRASDQDPDQSVSLSDISRETDPGRFLVESSQMSISQGDLNSDLYDQNQQLSTSAQNNAVIKNSSIDDDSTLSVSQKDLKSENARLREENENLKRRFQSGGIQMGSQSSSDSIEGRPLGSGHLGKRVRKDDDQLDHLNEVMALEKQVKDLQDELNKFSREREQQNEKVKVALKSLKDICLEDKSEESSCVNRSSPTSSVMSLASEQHSSESGDENALSEYFQENPAICNVIDTLSTQPSLKNELSKISENEDLIQEPLEDMLVEEQLLQDANENQRIVGELRAALERKNQNELVLNERCQKLKIEMDGLRDAAKENENVVNKLRKENQRAENLLQEKEEMVNHLSEENQRVDNDLQEKEEMVNHLSEENQRVDNDLQEKKEMVNVLSEESQRVDNDLLGQGMLKMLRVLALLFFFLFLFVSVLYLFLSTLFSVIIYYRECGKDNPLVLKLLLHEKHIKVCFTLLVIGLALQFFGINVIEEMEMIVGIFATKVRFYLIFNAPCFYSWLTRLLCFK